MAGAALAAAASLVLAAPAVAAAPDPGGDEHASVSLPPAGKEFGFNGAFTADGWLNDSIDVAAQAPLITRAGGTSARMPVEWWGLEPQRDVWSAGVWARHTLTYTTLRANGIRPHLVLME